VIQPHFQILLEHKILKTQGSEQEKTHWEERKDVFPESHLTFYRKKPAVAQSQKLPQQKKNNTTSNQCEKKGKKREGITMIFQRKVWNLEIECEKKS